MTAFVFNAREVEPDQGRAGPIPAGWYKVLVSSTEVKPTANGEYIAVTYDVLEGAGKGSKIFTNFNVKNTSEKAMDIGRKQFSALCYAVQRLDITDTDQLKNIPFFVRLKVKPAEMDPANPAVELYAARNEPTAYRDINDQLAIAESQKLASGPATAAARPATPPPAAAAMPPQQAWGQPPAAAPQAQTQPPAGWGQPPAAAPAQAAPPAAWGQPPAAAPAQQPPAGQPAWAAAPDQPWGQPAAAAPAAHAAPVATPEQQAAHAAAATAPPPWAQPA